MNSLKSETRKLITAALFLALAIIMQLIGRFNPDISRLFVGPIVNMVIILTAYYSGKKYGILTAILTPILALITGQLKTALAVFIPFIIISNILLIIVFIFFNKNIQERIISLTIGSILKFAFLFVSVNYLLNIFGIKLALPLLKALKISMGITQLFAAFAGTILALLLIEVITTRIGKDRSFIVKQ